MTAEHRGDFVTVLRSGNETLVKCPCALPEPGRSRPAARAWIADAEEDVVWIRSLQAMLNDYDAKEFPHAPVTGEYDARDRRAG